MEDNVDTMSMRDCNTELCKFARRTIIFRNPGKANRTIQRIAKKFSEVSVSGEGENIGPCGEVSVLQIGTCDGMCFMFDLQTCPALVDDGGLKFLLESHDVIKVIHDCRALSAALYCRFKIALSNIFDTHCAHAVIQSQFNSTSPYDIPVVNLRYICEKYSCGENSAANFIRKYSRSVADIDWTRRPFFNHTVCYAAARVMCLVPEIYENMKSLICPKTWGIYQNMTHLHIIYHVFPDEYEAETKRLMQRRYQEMLVVKQVEECLNSTDKPQVTKNIERLLGKMKSIKSNSTKSSTKSSASKATITKRSLKPGSKEKAQSEKASLMAKRYSRLPKSCGSRSTRTEVKLRRNNKQNVITTNSRATKSCGDGCRDAPSKKLCGTFKATRAESARRLGSSEGKKTARFGKGFTIPPDKCRSNLDGSPRKILKRRSHDCNDEPADKKRKMTSRHVCDHRQECAADKEARHVVAMTKWMDYLDLCRNKQKAMTEKPKRENSSEGTTTTDPGKTSEYLSAGSDKYKMEFCYDDSVAPNNNNQDGCQKGRPQSGSFWGRLWKDDSGCTERDVMIGDQNEERHSRRRKCPNAGSPKKTRSPQRHKKFGSPRKYGKSRSPRSCRKPHSPRRHKKSRSPRSCRKPHSPRKHRKLRSPRGCRKSRSPRKRRKTRSKSPCSSKSTTKTVSWLDELTGPNCDGEPDPEDSCDYGYNLYELGSSDTNPLPCGVYNCQATSCSKLPKKTVLTDREANNTKCFRDEGNKCTCIDCWLLGAESESDCEAPRDGNEHKCDCGCSCLCYDDDDAEETRESTQDTSDNRDGDRRRRFRSVDEEMAWRKAKTAAVDRERKFHRTCWRRS